MVEIIGTVEGAFYCIKHIYNDSVNILGYLLTKDLAKYVAMQIINEFKLNVGKISIEKPLKKGYAELVEIINLED